LRSSLLASGRRTPWPAAPLTSVQEQGHQRPLDRY
jgi:hypothetical protein